MGASKNDGKLLIQLMIGRCISEWASLEETLFDIFCMALGANGVLSAVVFYKSPTLDTRTALTTELIEAWFPKKPGEHDHPMLKEWHAIRGEILDQVVYRNLMAHHPVTEAESGYKVAHLQSEEQFRFIRFGSPTKFKVETSKSEQLRKRTIRSMLDQDMKIYHEDVISLHLRMKHYRDSWRKLSLSPSS